MKFFSKNIFIYSSIIYLIIIQFSYEQDTSFDFLEDKTIDSLRQILWSGVQLLIDAKEINNYQIKEFFYQKRDVLKSKIKTITQMLNITYNDYDKAIESIKENSLFKINKEKDIYDLIDNEKIPRVFLLNFAFNIDKYSRIEKQEINSAFDYLNYLTRDDIVLFIMNKLDEYPILQEPSNFIKYILNDVNFKYNDIDDYLKTKSKKELIQIIYGFEKYCFNYENSESSVCQIAYITYNHESLDSYSQDELKSYITIYKRRLNIKDLDTFIEKIENHNFVYINPDELFTSKDNKDKLIENVKAFETYYNRKNKLENSLTKLDEYVGQLNTYQLIDILKWGMDIYPELLETVRFKDITSSQTNLQYGQVKDFVKTSKREELIKYCYNIHTYIHNITSKYDKNIIDLFRYNDIQLYSQIFNDTNKDINLQEKKNFDKYASLFELNFEEYLKNLQRNQLKTITKILINLYYLITESAKNDNKKLSEKKELLDSIEIMDTKNILKKSLFYTKELKIIYIDNFLEMVYKYKDFIENLYFSYYNNIMDFFKSTDINYLRLWARKYELEIRKLYSQRYVGGGLKNNFMNIDKFSKQDLLKIFDIYIYEYPELFHPEKFIKITGLDNGNTPHRFLVEKLDNIEEKKSDLYEKIIFSLSAYFEIKNIHINFYYREYLSDMLFDETKYYIHNNLLYSIFRIINIFPELNNMIFFEKICINPETRIIDFLYESNLFYNSTRNYEQMAYNIKNYYNKTNFIGYDLSEVPKVGDPKQAYIQYIKTFLTKPFVVDVKYKVLYGQFYTLFYDCSLYYANESRDVISNIYKALYNRNYTNVISNNKEEQINLICEAINTYDELQDVTNFDINYGYINIDSEKYNNVKDTYNFLKLCDNRQLFYYCLITNILKIQQEEKKEYLKQYEDIYLNINYMTRNSMIRYILNIAKADEDLHHQLFEDNLRKLIKKYMIDLGSDNIYDLTMH